MFMCDTCQYSTEDKSNYNRHIRSKSHLVKEQEKLTGKTKEEDLKEQKRLEKAQKQLEKIQLDKEKFAIKMQLERDKMEAKAKADAVKAEAKAKAEAEKMELRRQESEKRYKLQAEQEERLREKQRVKAEALKKIEDEKLAILEAKQKQEEEDKQPYDVDYVFDETNFLNISKMMDFNFKHHMIPKHRKYFIHKLLKAFLDVPKLRCFRINSGNLEFYNSEWQTHSCGCVDDPELQYEMKDLLYHLINFSRCYPDYNQYRNPFRVEVENTLGESPTVRMKELKRILECNDVSFIDDKQKYERECQAERAEQSREEELQKSKNRDKEREQMRKLQEEQDRKDEYDLKNHIIPEISKFDFQFVVDNYRHYEKSLEIEPLENVVVS